MDGESTISKYVKQVRDNRLHRKYEREVSPSKANLAFDSDVKTHNEEFKKSCPEGFKAWIESRKADTGKKPSMLVLMGQVGILRELDIPGVAVALVDDRDAQIQSSDLDNRRELIEGDLLLYKDTFSKVKKTMEDFSIDSIDLAILRGYQGNNNLTDDINIQGKILNEVIKILNPDGGVLMVHGGTRIPQDVLITSLDKLSGCPQLKIEHFENDFGLTTDIKITKLGQVDIQEF